MKKQDENASVPICKRCGADHDTKDCIATRLRSPSEVAQENADTALLLKIWKQRASELHKDKTTRNEAGIYLVCANQLESVLDTARGAESASFFCECGHSKFQHATFSDHDECIGYECECDQFRPRQVSEAVRSAAARVEPATWEVRPVYEGSNITTANLYIGGINYQFDGRYFNTLRELAIVHNASLGAAQTARRELLSNEADQTQEYKVVRFRDGKQMAESGRVFAVSEDDALGKGRDLFPDCPWDAFRVSLISTATPPAPGLPDKEAEVLRLANAKISKPSLYITECPWLQIEGQAGSLEYARNIYDWMEHEFGIGHHCIVDDSGWWSVESRVPASLPTKPTK